MGGVITDRDALLLQTPEAIKARFNIDVLVNTRAEAIDRTAHTVTDLATGAARRLHYDRLVLAPGATPVRPSIPGIEWALTLRNVEAADALAAAAQRAAVVKGSASSPRRFAVGDDCAPDYRSSAVS